MKLLKYAGFVPYLAIAFINASVDLAHKITIQNVLLKSFSGESLVVLTALINAMILLPFIFLFSPSAFINDKFSRTNVIRYSSLAAVAISSGILLSYMTGMFALSFVLTLILAAQSAVYSPAKYSIIKSIVGTENIGMANGVIQALTIIFCAIASPILGITTLDQFISYTLVGYVYKCLVEIVLMPISYPVIGWFKRHEVEYKS